MRQTARAIVIHNQHILLMKRNKFGLQYYCLVGGGIDIGETANQAVIREVKEETSLIVVNPRLTYIEEAGDPYGTQYIFVCDYQDGEVHLDPKSIESQLNKGKKNIFEPLWLPVSKFAGIAFRSKTLQQEILAALRDGFPAETKMIRSSAEISYTETNPKEE